MMNHPRMRLTDAVAGGYVDDVRRALAAGEDPNKIERDRRHVCLLATERGRAECLAVLLAAGADPDVRGGHGQTLLQITCVNGWRHGDEVAVIVAAGCDPDAPHPNGQVPLEIAARYGCKRCCVELLRGGAALPKKLTAKKPYNSKFSGSAIDFLKKVERVGSYAEYVKMVAFHRDPRRVVEELAACITRLPVPVLRHVADFSGPVVD